jgi:Glycosyl hydrolase family 99
LRRFVLPALAVAALLAAAAAHAAPLTVAAYYYPWFAPDHSRWDAGYVRSQLDVPQAPLLGEYDSRDPAVIDQHYAWAHEYGVGAFFCSWDGPGGYSDGTIRDSLLPSPARGPTQIALLYESLARFPIGPDARIHLDAAGVQRLVDDFDYIARTYFDLPGYYEIDGRPVVVIYASRVFVGPLADAIHEIRQRLETAYGVDPYLIGDEVDWDTAPDPARIRLFDAITGYTLYSRTQPATWTDADFLRQVTRRVAQYRAVAEAEGVGFVPGAMPGYDDLGERLGEDHHVLPRTFAPAGAPSLLQETLGLAGALVDPRLDLLTVTSWNEWGEDTQVEPTAPAAPSGGPFALTQGYPFASYGTTPLEEIAAFAQRWDDGPRGLSPGPLPSR